MKNYLFITTLLFLSSGCAKKAEEKEEKEETVSASASSSSSTKWRASAFPLNIKVSSSFSTDEYNGIGEMIGVWNAADNKTYFSLSSTRVSNVSHGGNLDLFDDATLGIYPLTSWPSSLTSSALAITQAYGEVHSSYIEYVHADILVNKANYDFSVIGDPDEGYDFKTVILHELGHFLGFGHYTGPQESIMITSITRNTINQNLSSLDVRKLSKLYQSVAALSNEEEDLLFPNSGEKRFVRIQHELNAEGECRHYIDNHFYELHSIYYVK